MDQNTFINTYIDIIINSLQDYVKANLQLQTQVKVHEFVVADKDQIIDKLTKQLNENKLAEDWKTKYEAAEANYSAVLVKLNHMNGMIAQISEMKNIISQKDAIIQNLNNEIEEIKSSKKVINTKTKKKDDSLSLILEKENEKTLDDF